MDVTAFDVAARFVGLAEAPGALDNPAIVAMLQLEDRTVLHDETPWCSAFVNYVAWLLGLSRSNSLAARSWLEVGMPVLLPDARKGNDVVVLARGAGALMPARRDAPGHVGFFAGWDGPGDVVRVLGGNQGDRVSFATFPKSRVLGVRRLV